MRRLYAGTIGAISLIASWQHPALGQQRDPTAIINEIQPRQAAYIKCLIAQAVELGADNREPAETILRAVAATCRPAEYALRALYAETPLPQTHIEQLMIRDRKTGEDSGIAALLKFRANRQK